MYLGVICMKSKKMAIFKDLSLGICLAVVYFLAKFQAEAKKKCVVRHDQDPTKTYTRTNSHTLTHSHTLTNTHTHVHTYTHTHTHSTFASLLWLQHTALCCRAISLWCITVNNLIISIIIHCVKKVIYFQTWIAFFTFLKYICNMLSFCKIWIQIDTICEKVSPYISKLGCRISDIE